MSTYPVALNSFSSGNTIESEEWNALEAKIGVNGSSVATSLDYLLKNTASSNPGHKHTLSNGATDITASATELNYTNGVTSAIQTQIDSKQASDAGLTSLSGLIYASDSFIKVTATDTYAIRTIAETKTDLSLNNVENTALSTWAGSANLITLGTITTGVWNGTTIAVANGGTNATTVSGARTSLGLVAGGGGDIWVEKAGDTMTGDLNLNTADLNITDGTANIQPTTDIPQIFLQQNNSTNAGWKIHANSATGDLLFQGRQGGSDTTYAKFDINGGLDMTIADTKNVVALTLTNNDTTNNPTVFQVVNAGSGFSFELFPTLTTSLRTVFQSTDGATSTIGMQQKTSGFNVLFSNIGLGLVGGGTGGASPDLLVSNNHSVVIGTQAALSTSATAGFLYIPTSAGVPVGTPASFTGKVAMEFDTTNNDLYVYDGGWVKVALA